MARPNRPSPVGPQRNRTGTGRETTQRRSKASGCSTWTACPASAITSARQRGPRDPISRARASTRIALARHREHRNTEAAQPFPTVRQPPLRPGLEPVRHPPGIQSGSPRQQLGPMRLAQSREHGLIVPIGEKALEVQADAPRPPPILAQPPARARPRRAFPDARRPGPSRATVATRRRQRHPRAHGSNPTSSRPPASRATSSTTVSGSWSRQSQPSNTGRRVLGPHP